MTAHSGGNGAVALALLSTRGWRKTEARLPAVLLLPLVLLVLAPIDDYGSFGAQARLGGGGNEVATKA